MTHYTSDTYANSINAAGAISGSYDIITIKPTFSSVAHGLLRNADGTITTFDVPGAADTFVLSNSINDAGTIAGIYYDASMASDGYVRAPDGTFEKFDVPGTSSTPGLGLYSVCINDAGTVAGTYHDANRIAHGFRRARNGSIKTFDPPGSTGTYTSQINRSGAITGSYCDANSCHGFLLRPKCGEEGGREESEDEGGCRGRDEATRVQ